MQILWFIIGIFIIFLCFIGMSIILCGNYWLHSLIHTKKDSNLIFSSETYLKKEIEELKKKYDCMDGKAEYVFCDNSSEPYQYYKVLTDGTHERLHGHDELIKALENCDSEIKYSTDKNAYDCNSLD